LKVKSSKLKVETPEKPRQKALPLARLEGWDIRNLSAGDLVAAAGISQMCLK
jgi:hypothetical protein